MKLSSIIAAVVGALCLPLFAAERPWVPLFNGKDLSGWTPKVRGCPVGENFQNTFRVVNGSIQVNYNDYAQWENRFGHLFYAKPFSHYRLRLDYRFTGKQLSGGPGWAFRNSGIMVHSEAPATMELQQDFPASLEVQLLGGTGSGERSTGNLCTPGTHVVFNDRLDTRHCISSKSKTYHGDQWVHVEVEVHGNDVIRHWINGEEVISYKQAQLGGDSHAEALTQLTGDKMLKGGYICLQSESHPVEFREIHIQELDP